MMMHLPNTLPVLGFFQLGSSQLNTFETFLGNAVHGIQGMGIINGMSNVAYAILLVGFLWEVYGTVLHGGDVKGLGRAAVKFLATALVVQAWPDVFTQVNSAFVHAGQWMTGQGGVSNVLDTWQQQLNQQFQQDGYQHMWNLITGEVAGLLDALLIFVAYLLYPIATLIFGFFYMLMGSILFIFGPIVVALLPLGAANKLAKSYIEHIFIWNAWPLLYGGLGLLMSVVHIDNLQTVLSSQNFLGGLQNMEGSLMVGLISIVYSCAIAVIPFMAKSIVTGDIGSAARHMLSAATTAVSAGVGAAAGAAAGLSAAKAGAAAGGGSPANAGNSQNPGGAKDSSPLTNSNQPAPPQPPPTQNANLPAGPSQDSSIDNNAPAGDNGGSKDAAGGGEKGSSPDSAAKNAAKQNTASANQMTEGFKGIQDGEKENVPTVDGSNLAKSENGGDAKRESSPAPNDSTTSAGGKQSASPQSKQGQSSQSSSRGGGGNQGPKPQHGLSSWAAYHAARVAMQGAANAGGAISSGAKQVADAVTNPIETASKIGESAGTTLGNMAKNANTAKQAINKGVDAVSHPGRTLNNAAQKTSDTAKEAASGMKERFQQAFEHAKNTDSKGDNQQA